MHVCMQASQQLARAAFHENRSSLVAYVRYRTRTNVLFRVLPPAAQKNCYFSGLHPARWLGLLLHKPPVPITRLVWKANAQTCNAEVLQGWRRAGSVAAEKKPRRDVRLLFNSKRTRPWAHRPHTTECSSSPAMKVGATADPHSVRTSGATPVGRCMAARDTANSRYGSLFI